MLDRIVFWVLGTALFISIAMVGTLMTVFLYEMSATTIALTEIAATAVVLLLFWAYSALGPQSSR